MGNFKIEIEAVGNHGADRTAKEGEAFNPGVDTLQNPDALASSFVQQLKTPAGSSIVSAKLIHWPDTTPIVDNLLTGVRESGDFAERWQGEEMLKYFAFSHLPEGPMRETSRGFCHLAYMVVRTVPRSPERTVALRKLLEGKDAAVRAAMQPRG
jgi:hypothetical protein